MPAGLISIIGPVAAGKTTLATSLAKSFGARLLKEDYAGNPFLTESYTGDLAARLPGQIYFLMSRAKQFAEATWPQQGLCIADHGFCQDEVFAAQRLSAEDRRIYEQVLTRVAPLIHPPDVLVSLDASAKTLRRRIARRGREFERVMDEAFLESLRRRYRRVEAEATCHVIRIDCDAVDLREPAELAGVTQRLREFESLSIREAQP